MAARAPCTIITKKIVIVFAVLCREKIYVPTANNVGRKEGPDFGNSEGKMREKEEKKGKEELKIRKRKRKAKKS